MVGKRLAHCLEHSKHYIFPNYKICRVTCLAKYYLQIEGSSIEVK